MEYPEYHDDLYAIYKSEVTGEAMFSVTAALSLSASNKKKWQALRDLETLTKQRYLEYLQANSISYRYPVGALLGGWLFGIVFSLLPWRTAMKGLLSGTEPLIAVFNRLLSHCDEGDTHYFESVVAHEQAIDAFAASEVRGETESSLDPVQALLDTAR